MIQIRKEPLWQAYNMNSVTDNSQICEKSFEYTFIYQVIASVRFEVSEKNDKGKEPDVTNYLLDNDKNECWRVSDQKKAITFFVLFL